MAPGLEKTYRIAAWGLFISALVVIFAVFQDFGVTWDEHYHDDYGRHVLNYYMSGFKDLTALSYHNLWLYGAAFDGPTALAKRLLPFGDFETQHLMSALVGLLGALGCYRIAAHLAGPRAGFWAALFLLLTPPWFGHMFMNPKDIPFATGMTWTLYFIIRAAPLFPRVPGHLVVKLGLAIGLTLGVRIAGIFTFFYVGAALLGWLAWRLRDIPVQVAVRESLRAGFGFILPMCIVAYLVMLAAWPWAQWNPLLRPFEALTIFSHSPWDIDTLFAGALVNSRDLPAAYLPGYFLVKTPELILVLLALALVAAVAAVQRVRRQDWPQVSGYFMLGFAVLFPFAFFVLFRPVSYDAIRHFLFVLPPIAIVAALMLDRLFAALAARSLTGQVAFAAVIGAYVAWHGAYMAKLHPNQYVYYNQLTGGVAGAAGRYELDYWGNSYHEAVDRLVAFVRAEQERTGVVKTTRVLVCSEGTSAGYFFPKDMTYATSPLDADFYIAVTRLGCDTQFEGDTVITVARDDATLSVVKDRRRLRDVAPERLAARQPQTARKTVVQHPGLTVDGRPLAD